MATGATVFPQTRSNGGKNTHQSLQRAVAIMRLFTEKEPALTVAEISQKLDLHKSTVSRILGALYVEGLVEHNDQTGQYSLGVGLITLAGVALGRISARAVSLPHMEQLANETEETITLSILRGFNSVCVACIPAPQSVRYVVWIGRRVPLHATASGKVLLAYQNVVQRRHHLRYPLAPLTPHTHTNSDGLTHQLNLVAQQGYALEVDEFEEGTSALAAPVFNHEGTVTAAISIAGPSYRLDENRLLAWVGPLRRQAEAISGRLGFIGRQL
ncbi:MAG: IclR family transcriptional regulator [Chloroflexota bacterium]